MFIQQVGKNNILKTVMRAVSGAKKEIITTMLLKEELGIPLPASYFNLLENKINEGVFLKRLGFGTKEDYNKVKKRIRFRKENYIFRFFTKTLDYQRLIIIDRKKLFFGKDNIYLKSIYKPLIKVFSDYFFNYFKKGNI